MLAALCMAASGCGDAPADETVDCPATSPMIGSDCNLSMDDRCNYVVDQSNVPIQCTCQERAWVCSHNDELGLDLRAPSIPPDLSSAD